LKRYIIEFLDIIRNKYYTFALRGVIEKRIMVVALPLNFLAVTL
jgi:hypothetical protein